MANRAIIIAMAAIALFAIFFGLACLVSKVYSKTLRDATVSSNEETPSYLTPIVLNRLTKASDLNPIKDQRAHSPVALRAAVTWRTKTHDLFTSLRFRASDYTEKEASRICKLRSHRSHFKKQSGNPSTLAAHYRAQHESFLSNGKKPVTFYLSQVHMKQILGWSACLLLNRALELTRRNYIFKVWFNPRNYVTDLHDDNCSNIVIQLSGTKVWSLISPKYRRECYPNKNPNPLGNYYFAVKDPGSADSVRFPLFSKVKVLRQTLRAGDMLYLPKRYIHRVESTDYNCMLSLIRD